MNSNVDDSQLREALEDMILSASGWRKVFAPGGEHHDGRELSDADLLLGAGMGVAWGGWLKDRRNKKDACVLVCTDTRPTGPALARALSQGLVSEGCTVRYAGIAAAPEAMARSLKDSRVDAFAYISASHNPLGHNGVKFGTGGGVIGGNQARDLIARYKTLISGRGTAAGLASIYSSRTSDGQLTAESEEKRLCLQYYKEFLQEIAGGPGDEASQQETLAALRSALAGKPVTVVADLNGSARCLSSDRSYLEDLGVRLETFNDRAGEIAHAILPEGEALEPCRRALEKAHAADPNALIGYVPDNDGDRGNLVIWDEGIAGARILEAQEVFALSTLAEFAAAAWGNASPSGEPASALVVSGPTSHRVREIAAAYGAEVHEAEVGEANVVNRAAELRAEGYRVRLLGEGSNGGTITHPAAVRDPMNTITALLKLMRLPSLPGRPAPFRDWCERIGRPEAGRGDFGPADIVATLPVYTTTPASKARALAAVHTRDQGALKSAWEEIFGRQWSLYKDRLKEICGFADWIEVNNEGTESRVGMGDEMRSGAKTGGLKVVFKDEAGKDGGFIWMRGSGTEPVFRVMAEIRGADAGVEKSLVEWQGAMVAAADRMVRGEAAAEETIPPPII